MSKRLYPILVVALMASLVLPRVVSPLHAQDLDEQLKIASEQGREIQQQNRAFSQKLRNLQQEQKTTVQPETRVDRRDLLRDVNRKDLLREDVLEQRAESDEAFGSRLQQRFTLYKTRLYMIIDKLQARIERLNAAGKDTTAAQTKLDEAQALLQDANTSGSSAVQLFTGIQLGDLSVQSSELEAAREKAQATRDLYFQVMKLLQETIAILRTM